MSAHADEDDYWTAIGHGSDDDFLDSIAVSADVIAVTGPSGKWGCWGERGTEVALGGRGPVPDEYAAALAENYGTG
ncbi:hypothetical protein [Amycolatopsis sp. NPDC004079]|uniref:hypothetical protein n=1 Tax=Amycolatopsis sp. NPDC004079 TaxID=3154549 RepID=UPI0033AA12A7